ncbi:MAG: trigger factor [Lachnospiraceae bacterium]|jgi:trigger factor|nr:trigger factor [Lachnospiraceae bacterium]
MSVKVENLEAKNMVKLTVEVSAEDLDAAIENVYQKEKKKIQIPGFRKGHVPKKMIEKTYGSAIFYEDAANALIQENYPKAYDESGLDIVSRPTIDVVQLEEGKPFIFTAEVAVKPEVTLGDYKGLEVEKNTVEVTDEDIENRLKEEAEKNARTVVVTDRAVADKDEVILDFEGFVDGVPFEGGKGENYPLVIGSGSFIPGFEEQVIGKNTDEEFDVNVTFPEDYQAEELKGKEAVFKCTVHEIKAKELPEIDDEFASEVSDYDTLDEYKSFLKNEIFEGKEKVAKQKKEDAVVSEAVKNASMDIPKAMIETQVAQMADDFARRIQQQGLTVEQYFQFTGMTQEKLFDDLRPQAIKNIETRLVLEAIVKAEKIETSDERIEEEIAKMAEQYKMEIEKVKEFIDDSAKKSMKEDIAVQDAITLLADSAVEVEKKEEK